ncbi:MAG: glycosyltransferase family 4 protein [Cyanobacteria bacterium P01_C01_bin.72]
MFNDKPTVGLIHNYDLIDEVVAGMKITFRDYCENFVGSFMFNYIKALQTAGVDSVLYCITTQVNEATRFEHLPTGATICALPTRRIYAGYSLFKSNSLKAYGAQTGQTFKDVDDRHQWRRSSLVVVKDLIKSVGTYLATPTDILARELQRDNCLALLCQEYEYARFDDCVAMGKKINLPIYACFQGLDRTQSILESAFRRRSLVNCAGLIIASSREIARVKEQYSFPATKIHQIFNPLSLPESDHSVHSLATTRAELGISPSTRVVVWHGRVEIAQKGLDILLLAWQQICQIYPNQELCLLLIGTGTDAPKLKQQIEALNLTNIVWINKFISDRTLLSRYLSAADLYTLPSRWEGFPLAPVEAMAVKLPVVLTDVAGIKDILPGETADGGIIIPPEDASALARAIAKLLDDFDLRQKLGKRAKQRAQCFSLQAIGLRMREVLIGK